jgi:hypothetical protein
MPSKRNVFLQNVGVLCDHLAQVAAQIGAGQTKEAAEALKVIGEAAIWLGGSLEGTGPRSLPIQILPGNACQPTFIEVPRAGTPPVKPGVPPTK